MTEAAIAAYLRHRSTSRGRQWERLGPFLATFSTHDSSPASYAIPDDGASPSRAQVDALVAAFERRGRVPRIQYLPVLAPAVQAAVLTAGLAVEDRAALMTCQPASAADLGPPPGIELVLAASDAPDAVLAAARSAQRQAFGGPAQGGPEGVRRLRADVAAGGLAVLAWDAETGRPAGAGCTTVPAGGVTELVGIAVPPAYRRRGIGRAMTARLAREAFAAGVTTAFLSPLDEGVEQGVYAPAGFTRTAEMLHLAR